MDNILEVFLGIILGAILTYWVYGLFRKKKREDLTKHQSSVLLDKIKSVCKLIAVEGDFAEVYQYENSKTGFLNLVSSKKKALIIVKAKAHIGYDLKKVKIQADEAKKTIIIKDFPQPEVLSIEPELQFYDIKNGLFNSFSPDDLTTVNLKAKEYIKEKIPESGLMETAGREAIEAILLIEKLAETIGWQLDYRALELNENEKLFLNKKQDKK